MILLKQLFCYYQYGIHYPVIREIVQQVKEKEKDFVSSMQNIFRFIQHKYHTEGNSPWDDRTYDLLLELLTDKYQLNLEKQVGSNISSAVTLPFYMGSMNKIKTIKHIENWKKKYKAPYLFSAKLDGISAMFVNKNINHRIPMHVIWCVD